MMQNSVTHAPSILYATNRSHIVIERCKVLQNVGYYGAIFINDTCHISVIDSVFDGNVSPNQLQSPGTLTVKLNSTASILRSNFSYNQAIEGAAVTVLYNSFILVSDSTFTNNKACVGGAIAIAFKSKMQIDNCTFYRNSASRGILSPRKRFMKNDDDSFTNIETLLQKNSRSIHREGFMHFYTQMWKNITLENMFSTESDSLIDTRCNGGAIMSVNSKLHVSNGMFQGNRASDYAGAIYAQNKSVLELDSCLFYRNIANKTGGAVFIPM